MFTGIIGAVGNVITLQPQGMGWRVRIHTGALDLADMRVGDSIAINGVCLTATELATDGFWADVSHETLEHTTLVALRPGTRVNSKGPGGRCALGGHLVSGHVDASARLSSAHRRRSLRLRVEAPAELARYITARARSVWMASA